MQHDIGIYIAHAGFFGSFVIARGIAAMAPRDQRNAAVVSSQAATAPASRTLFVTHVGAFCLLYFGIAAAVFGPQPRLLFPPQIVIGALLIASGAVLSCWTLLYFRSWRFRATIGIGHELATGGPFRILRHPIYLSLTLLALGTRAVAADRFHLGVIRHHRCPVGPACPIGGDPAAAGLR